MTERIGERPKIKYRNEDSEVLNVQAKLAVEQAKIGKGEKLYEYFQQYVKGPTGVYLKSFGVEEDHLQDLSQDAILRALMSIGRFEFLENKFQPHSQLSGWMSAIMRNKAIDEHRRDKKFGGISIDEIIDENSDGAEILGYNPSIENEILTGLEFQEMFRIATKLTKDQRNVVFLKYIFDCSIPEISERLNKRPSAIRALLMRGLHSLKRLTQEDENNVNAFKEIRTLFRENA